MTHSPIVFLRKPVLALAFFLSALVASAQMDLGFDPTIPLIRNGSNLAMGWAGGLNCPQVSDIDLNADGYKDLFIFDKTTAKSLVFLNNGVSGQVSYTFTHAYDNVEPFNKLEEWVLLRDYNMDGKEDIFTYTTGGFCVWKNTTTGTEPSFLKVDTLVRSNYVPTDANLYVTQVDIPGIEDIDNDGDLDIITFSIFGNYEEFHKNLSMELYGVPDSLEFEVANRCWGFFSENLANNSVTLNNPCQFNVPDPEFPLHDDRPTPLEPDHRDAEEGGDERAHVGSTSLPIDLDGDGDKDLLLGDVLFSNLLALTNGGQLDSAIMVAQDSLFPIYDEPVNLQIFPAPFYEDVNNDGRRDLLVSPMYPSLSENVRSLWYYNNIGTDAAPVFDKVQEDLLQQQMLDLGEGAYPVPFDLDGDGLMDLVVPNYGYFGMGGVYPSKMAALRNTGTATAPAFTLLTDDYMGFSVSGIGNSMYPAFGDLDGDGDKDLLVGDLQGRLHYYRNDPQGNTAQFVLDDPTVTAVVDGNTVLLDVGQFATPQLFDMDDDGQLDLLIGERNGNLNYYRNLGNVPEPRWELVNDSVGGVLVTEWWNVTGYSVPFMYRNASNQRELVLGSERGWIYWYDNIDGNLNGTWNLVDSTWQDIREGTRTAVALYDFTGDGELDAVIGNYRGGLSFWRNNGMSTQTLNAWSSEDAFRLMPNPASNACELLLNVPVTRSLSIGITNELGQPVVRTSVRDRRSDLNITGLHSGVYTVRVEDGDHQWTQRLVIVH